MQRPPLPVDKFCCMIGAGPSGISTARRLRDNGIEFDWFDASDDFGGNWYHQNPNGMSACYQSLHIDTAKNWLSFEEFPVPESWPDYPHHTLILQYLRDYVDHFGLRALATFNTRVERAVRGADGIWEVTLSTGAVRRYNNLLVGNGHHWDPKSPDPYPGEFTGEQIHSHQYRSPSNPLDMFNKRVLVVGAGNSSMDISSELSQRCVASKVFVSMRHGVWVVPKYHAGRPFGEGMPKSRPKRRKEVERRLQAAVGAMSNYGLPEPDYKPWQGHGTVSSEFLLRAGSGDLTAKSGIRRFDGKDVTFTDGSTEQVDVIVWATGYKISFPFFTQPEFKAKNNVPPPLFKRVMIPGVDNLFYLGLGQAMPTVVNYADHQSKLIVEYLTGRYTLPSKERILKTIAKDEKYHTGDFYSSTRHTIQCDLGYYIPDLLKEIEAGHERARRHKGSGKSTKGVPGLVKAQ